MYNKLYIWPCVDLCIHSDRAVSRAPQKPVFSCVVQIAYVSAFDGKKNERKKEHKQHLIMDNNTFPLLCAMIRKNNGRGWAKKTSYKVCWCSEENIHFVMHTQDYLIGYWKGFFYGVKVFASGCNNIEVTNAQLKGRNIFFVLHKIIVLN